MKCQESRRRGKAPRHHVGCVSKADDAEDTKDTDVSEDEGKVVNERLQWAIDELVHNRGDVEGFAVGDYVEGVVVEELEDGVGVNVTGGV